MIFRAYCAFCLMFAVAALCQVAAAAQEVDFSPGVDRKAVKEIRKLAQTDPAQALRRMREIGKNLTEKAPPEDQRYFRAELTGLLVELGQYDAAKVEIGKLKEHGVRFHDNLAMAQALQYESVVMFFEGKLDQAQEAIEKAIPLAAKSAQDDVIASANDTAARIYLDQGNFRAALEHELASLDALKGADKETLKLRANSLDSASQIYAGLKDGKKALEYSDKAIALAKSIGMPELADTYAIDLGVAYSLTGELETAKKSFEQALQAARRSGDVKTEMIALGDLSDAARRQEKFAQCADYAQAALAMAEKIQVSEVILGSSANLGLCHISMGMLKPGQAEIARGFDGLRKANDLKDLEEGYGQLATAYNKAGQYKSAMEALQEQRTLAEKIFQTDRDQAMAQMQARFDASERQRKIDLLEKQNTIQSDELENKNLQRTVAILSAILVIVVAFVIIREKEESRRKAHKNNLDKSKFIADAAHDLRQPMQAIGNLLEASRHAFSRGDMAKGQELVDSAQSAAQSMRSSFNSVLELSRLESGALSADYSEFSLAALIEEICLPIRPLADQRGVNIRLAMSKKPGMVRSDRHLLSRVLSNLITNAIKYSDAHKGGKAAVIIGVVALPGRYRIDVVDNGIGIAAADQENIFKPFFQVDNPEQDREKGLGLGLSIVTSIMRLLEGHHLAMRSRPRLGTRFSLDVPGSHDSRGIEAAGKRMDEGEDEGVAEAGLAGLYVLYIEDDVMLRKATEALLIEFGVLCDVSKSLEELKEKLPGLERLPDLILTDYRLSENATAIDVVKAVFHEFQTAIPTILLTGESEGFQQSAGLEHVVVLRKPVSAATLLTQIRAAVSRHDLFPPYRM